MGRYFVAVVPEGAKDNPELKRLLDKLKRTVNEREKQARWIQPELWHVTLQFLGEIESEARVIECLERWRPKLGAAPLSLRLHGLGAFPEVNSARTLWIGVSKSQDFLDLQMDLSEHLRADAFNLDERDYQPHLSLVRFRNPASVDDLIGLSQRRFFGDYPVREVILFESLLQGHMPKYIPRWRRPLT